MSVVVFKVYSLDGRRVAKRSLGAQRFGAQRVRWDGRNGDIVARSLSSEVAPEAERQGVRRCGLTLIY